MIKSSNLKLYILIFMLEMIVHVGEITTLMLQTRKEKRSYVDQNYIKYQIKIAKTSFCEQISLIIFYVTLNTICRKLGRRVKKEYLYFSTIFLLRLCFTQLPSKYIRQFYIDKNSNLNILQIIRFFQEEIFTQFIYLSLIIVITFILSKFSYITKTFRYPKRDAPLANQIDDLELSESSGPCYSRSSVKKCISRERRRERLDKYAWNRPLYAAVFFILLFLVLAEPYINRFTENISGRFDRANIPLQDALSSLKTQTKLDITILSQNRDENLRIYSEGLFFRRFVVSEFLPTVMAKKDVVALLSSALYTANSYEAVFHFIISLIEVIALTTTTRVLFTKHFPELSSMAKRQLTVLVPNILISFFPYHLAFNAAHNVCSHIFIERGDVYSLKNGIAITDSLVKIYAINKDIVTHFKPYAILVKREPSITSRLSNIAITNLQLSKKNCTI